MTWARRLKRVFNIDIETGGKCGADVRSIACIEEPAVTAKILTHLNDKVALTGRALVPACRAPPPTELLV